MKKRYKLSSKQKERYYGLLRTARSISSEMQRKRTRIERETKEVINKRELPASVLPRKMFPKRSFASREEFQSEMKHLKKFKSTGYYYKSTYKKEILKLISDKIEDTAIEIGDAVEQFKPEGYFGRYADYQIEDSPELAGYMEMYNKLVGMPIDKFMDMYWRGYIVEFKYMYRELEIVGRTENAGNSYLEQQLENIEEYQELKRR